MDPQIMAFIPARRAVTEELHSALPNAPIVAPRERRHRIGPVRRGLARGLHRLADAVAPATPAFATESS
jgi:hypothetical protein